METANPEDPGPLVRRLREMGIADARVLEAFARVPRRAFVPAGHAAESEADKPLDIGYGQTISQPYIVAAMTQALGLRGHERVLEVGTGSGYQTAILRALLAPGTWLWTVEIVPGLSARAEATLTALGFGEISFHVGDGAEGLAGAAPFDCILVAAAPSRVPPALLAQLAPGGRLVLPVGKNQGLQELQLWRKPEAGGAPGCEVLLPVRFVPLTGGPTGLH